VICGFITIVVGVWLLHISKPVEGGKDADERGRDREGRGGGGGGGATALLLGTEP
jgi:hypothetical protein